MYYEINRELYSSSADILCNLKDALHFAEQKMAGVCEGQS